MELSKELTNITYLDNAATTYPKPKKILDSMLKFYAEYGVNPGRSGYDLCLVTGEMIDNTRKELTDFFGGTNPDYLTFSYNASDSLNIIIQGLLHEGDHAISTMIEHNSVIRPLNYLQKVLNIEVDFVPVGPDWRVDPDDIARYFRNNTKLVIVNHGSNVIGTIQPIAEIGKLCRERGIYFAVDAAQTAGMIPVNVEEMCIDALAFTGHKSLLGPTGIGGIYTREGIDIRYTRAGGTGVRSAVPLHLDEFPYRLEVGTVNVIGVAGLHYAQEYLAERGIEKIYKHEMEIFARLQEGVADIDGVIVHGTTSLDHRGPVLSFNIEGKDAADIGMLLDVDFNIATRTGLHCAPLIHDQLGTSPRGAVRMSIGPMNKSEDAEAGIEAVAEIAKEMLS